MPLVKLKKVSNEFIGWEYTPKSRPPVKPGGGRGHLIPGVHIPGPDNTGLYTITEAQLIDVFPSSGNSITLATGSYKWRRYWGILKASGPVTCEEIWGAGPDPDSWNKTGGSGQPSFGLVQNYGSNPSMMKFYDSVFDPYPWVTRFGKTLNPYNIGHHGGQAEYYRCEITNISDGVNFIGANGSIAIANAHKFWMQQCWVHKGLYANDLYPPNDGQPHCDAFQCNYGKNVTLWGNMFGGVRDWVGYNKWPGNPTSPGIGTNTGDDFWNATLMLKQENFTVAPTDPRYADRAEIARLDNFDIKENWFSGGTCTLNIASDIQYGNFFSTWKINDNRFFTRGSQWGQTMRGYAKGDGGVWQYNTGAGRYVLRNATTNGTMQFLRNVIHETGAPVPVSPGA